MKAKSKNEVELVNIGILIILIFMLGLGFGYVFGSGGFGNTMTFTESMEDIRECYNPNTTAGYRYHQYENGTYYQVNLYCDENLRS